MAANIFFKFSSLMSMSGTENDKYKFTLYTIYAQVCLHFKSLVSPLEPIVVPAKYRKLLGLDFCHDLSSSLCLQKVSLVKSFVSVI